MKQKKGIPQMILYEKLDSLILLKRISLVSGNVLLRRFCLINKAFLWKST